MTRRAPRRALPQVKLNNQFVARPVQPGFPSVELCFDASKYVADVDAFLAAARHSNTLDARFKKGSRKAGLGLRRCKEHPLLCGVGWWTHCALNPTETEALFPMAQVRSHACRFACCVCVGCYPLKRTRAAAGNMARLQGAAPGGCSTLRVVCGAACCVRPGRHSWHRFVLPRAAHVRSVPRTHATTRRLQPHVHRRWPSSVAHRLLHG